MKIVIKRGLINTAAFLCLGFLLFSVFNCKNNGDQERNELSSLTILLSEDERALSPSYDMSGQLIYFMPLVQVNAAGEIEGLLAERWEHSEDYREWTYYLRKNILWHDGMPFTSHDIAFTLDLRNHPDVLVGVTAESYEIVDDHTIRIRYKQSQFGLDWWGTFWPKHVLEKLDPKKFHKWNFWIQPVGNGAYRYVRHVPKTMIELKANPDYFRGKPKIDKVILKFGGNSIVELLSGNVQIASLAGSDVPKIINDGRFNFYYSWFGKAQSIFWNHRFPFFRDPKVRKALTLALDRKSLLKALYIPDFSPVDVIYTGDQWYRGEVPEGLPFDPDAAKRLLEEVGFSDTDNNGILDRDRKPFRFTALVQGGNGSVPYVAVFAQSAFRHIGIQMDISYLQKKVLSGRVKKGDFDAYFSRSKNSTRWNLPLFAPDSKIGAHNTRIESLLVDGELTANQDKLKAIYQEIWEFFQEEIPYTILFPNVYPVAVDKRVRGLSSPHWTRSPQVS